MMDVKHLLSAHCLLDVPADAGGIPEAASLANFSTLSTLSL